MLVRRHEFERPPEVKSKPEKGKAVAEQSKKARTTTIQTNKPYTN